jgi:hypothetical protein
MFIQTKSKKGIIDVGPWEDRMRNNVSLKRDIFEQTPICVKADKSYFWMDDYDDYKDLDTKSVKALAKSFK